MDIQIEIFPWNKNFETGITLIDEQHKQLVHLLNVLVKHLAFQSNVPEMDKVFEDLRDYVEYHFSCEEIIWKEHFEGDSWVKWHMLAHTNFVEEINTIKEEGSDKPYDEVIEQIVQFLTHWLAQHILDSDKRMAKVVLALPSEISLERAKEIANDEMTGVSRVLIETIMSMYDKLAHNALRMTREIKKRQLAEAEMRRAREAADAANRAKSEFISTMSHELRTPLNAILGFSELMAQDDTVSPKHKETLGIINRSGTHLLSMINDVLDISKIEAGRLEINNLGVDFFKLLHDISNMIRARAENKHLKFNLQIAPEVPEFINVDSGKLRQVLINLLGNAVKFTERGQITLQVQVLALSTLERVILEIEIIDTGAGIPDYRLNELFKPFVQLARTDFNLEGTGLGLTISKSLVELMGGAISVNSVFGAGSTFKIELPVAVATADDVVTETQTPTVKSLAPTEPAWKLLVVDDNPENRLLLATMLAQVGFQVETACNGLEAVTKFEQWQPALCWMDMRMPVLDGYQATRKIRQLSGGKTVKIIAITASVFKEQRDEMIAAGCDAVVHKPIQAAEVFATLSNYLGVKFIYQTVEPPLSSLNQKISTEMLNLVPVNLRQQLYEAASNLDIDETDAVIAKIRKITVEMAERLQELLEHYQFEQIIKLVETDTANAQ